VRILNVMLKDKLIGKRIVPIVPDESRTFGMEGLFRQIGIWNQQGQTYVPQDADQLMFYKESKDGQMLQEGINEAGAMSDWIAAATAYSTHGVQMLPFYIFYSMFGLQRTMDLCWAAGDSRARGFLVGATAGRTTLSGEGLQHQDGTSHLAASTVPNCRAYDPAFGYELAAIVSHGVRRLVEQQADEFYYLTVMNENYAQPAWPEGVSADDVVSGLYRLPSHAPAAPQVRLVGSGAILREVLAAAELLRDRYGIAAEVWSATSFTELARQAREVQRDNRLQRGELARVSRVERCLGGTLPVVAATDYVRAVPQLVAEYVGAPYVTLGTDGFGRSGTRADMRRFFEVDREHIALAALDALARQGRVDEERVKAALDVLNPAPTAAAPWLK
jgi:pyruvate dehydrogenase E1 component